MLGDEADVDDMAAMLEEVTREIEGLELENSVLETYLERQQEAGPDGVAAARPMLQASGGKHGGGGAPSRPAKLAKLATNQKCEIATGVLQVKRQEAPQQICAHREAKAAQGVLVLWGRGWGGRCSHGATCARDRRNGKTPPYEKR